MNDNESDTSILTRALLRCVDHELRAKPMDASAVLVALGGVAGILVGLQIPAGGPIPDEMLCACVGLGFNNALAELRRSQAN